MANKAYREGRQADEIPEKYMQVIPPPIQPMKNDIFTPIKKPHPLTKWEFFKQALRHLLS